MLEHFGGNFILDMREMDICLPAKDLNLKVSDHEICSWAVETTDIVENLTHASLDRLQEQTVFLGNLVKWISKSYVVSEYRETVKRYLTAENATMVPVWE